MVNSAFTYVKLTWLTETFSQDDFESVFDKGVEGRSKEHLIPEWSNSWSNDVVNKNNIKSTT